MRLLLFGCLLGVLLWPAMTVAGGADPAYGLGEPEPLDSIVGAAPETPASQPEESTPPSATPVAEFPQPFRIRLITATPPVVPAVSGLRYRPSASGQ